MPKLLAQPYVTAGQLRRLSSAADANLITALAPKLCVHMERREINTPRRVRHFIGQIAHECAGFRSLEEDLNYTAVRLRQVWPNRFPTIELAQSYANNPQKLANYVYGGRMGNTLAGSGWKYRGRSALMITGYDAYLGMQKITGLPLVQDPDLAANPEHAARIAADWWFSKGLNAVADEDAGETRFELSKANFTRNEADDCQALRKRINGGFNGLEDAMNWTLRAAAIWPDDLLQRA